MGVVSEYETRTASSEVGTRYLTADHLGSTCIVTDAGKQVKGRYDYLPFGEEIGSSIGGRTTVGGYTPVERTRQKFTGKERDKESGLDYFGARYYSSTAGRFTSIDPILITSERLSDPQRINLYAYVRNNPLKYIDPWGEDISVSGTQADRVRYEAAILKSTKLAIKVDGKGNVGYAGGKRPDGLTGAAAKIADAIDNHTKTVQISLVNRDGQVDIGTPFSIDSQGNLSKSVQRIDFADIDVVNNAKISDFTEDQIVTHETIEAIGIQMDGMSPTDAHDTANKSAPGLDRQGNLQALAPVPDDGSIVGYRQKFQVHGKNGSKISIDFWFDYTFRSAPGQKTPQTDLEVQQFRATHPLHVHNVSK